MAIIIGTSGPDVLFGTDEWDDIDGLEGADTMTGGNGSDTYRVDNAGDVVVESAGGGDTDTIISTISYTASDEVEYLYLDGAAAIDGTGNALDNYILGNEAANTLSGGAGDDFLVGEGGSDTLIGGTGNDGYYLESSSDAIIEAAGEGTDWVKTKLSYTLGGNLEDLYLGGDANRNGTGNSLDNYVRGNEGNNTIKGMAGNDVVAGWEGTDKLYGGSGADSFLFLTGGEGDVDKIYDFDEEEGDSIALNGWWFSELGVDSDDDPDIGALDPSMFYVGSSAANADHRIIYNDETGYLYYDMDGKGGEAKVKIGWFDDAPELCASNFSVMYQNLEGIGEG